MSQMRAPWSQNATENTFSDVRWK